MTTIFIDADGCTVKDETYRVAARYSLKTYVVANSYMAIPDSKLIERVLVSEGADKADDWIADNITECDIAVTSDIPLADRCLKKGARVVGPKGREFTVESIGNALASRELSSHLREMGMITGGPKPMAGKDRSRFLSKLDELVNAQLRKDNFK